jgi:hypothetical protein
MNHDSEECTAEAAALCGITLERMVLTVALPVHRDVGVRQILARTAHEASGDVAACEAHRRRDQDVEFGCAVTHVAFNR